MKNHYFVGEKEDPLRILYKKFMGYFLVLKLFPGDPILDNPDFRDPLLKKKHPRFS